MTKIRIEDLHKIKERVLSNQKEIPLSFNVCGGTGCHSSGSKAVIQAFKDEIKSKNLAGKIRLIETGCNGFCAKGPVLLVMPQRVFYQEVQASDVPELVETHANNGEPIERLLFKDPKSKQKIAPQNEIPFFKLQQTVALRNNGLIDAESIDDYIAQDGYSALAKALTEMTPATIIEEMKSSGLRGRGGAGFTTGLKWDFCAEAQGEVKYVLCNGDEGDPGAFMDRSILEADPHAVIEGMSIAARAIGAKQGYIYCRAEYPLAVNRLSIAINKAREYGLLGKQVLGTDFEFDLEIYEGAGAFVCGEETALMRSIEGKRGMPTPRPPFPAHKGLFSKPSVLNNVETLANVPGIILKGASWYSGLGSETSKGTKVFAVSGCIKNIGLIEVPMGLSIKTVVNDICGGVVGAKRKCKAVQIGGPSGGCLPESLFDTPIDYESITKTGAIMGSGGMVVMDNKSCMVDMARFFLDFTAEESCGKCTPCREGNIRLLQILTDITEGRGQEGDIERLEALSKYIIDSSLCGLGQTAPNPVLTTIKYFRHEYEAHIRDKRCPGKKCPALLKFEVDPKKCAKCGLCFKACPAGAVKWEKKQVASIDKAKCTKCMSCFGACEFDAID